MDIDFSVGGPGGIGSTEITMPTNFTSPMMMTEGPAWPPITTQPPPLNATATAATTTTPQHSFPNLFGLVIPGGPVRTDFIPVDATGTKFTMQWVPPISPTSVLTTTPNSPTAVTAAMDSPLIPPNSSSSSSSKPISSINEVVAFLLPQVSLPPNYGVLFFWQVSVSQQQQQQPSNGQAATTTSNTTGFALLGALTPNQPSSVFRTGWSEHEDLLQMELAAMSSTSSSSLPLTGLPTTTPPPPPLVVTFGVSLESLDNIQNLPIQHTDSNERRLFVAQRIATDLFQFMQSFDTGMPGGRGQMMVVPTNIFERWMKRFEARFRRDPNFFLKES